MKVNWLVRIKNRDFWLALVPAVLLLVMQVASAFGIELDLSGVEASIIGIIGSIFAILAIIGVVNDPTTRTLSDSKRAITYEEPR